MARSQRTWVQCELKLSTGAEAWVIVRHRNGWFRLPLHSNVEDLLTGVRDKWQDGQRRRTGNEQIVRVPLHSYRQALAKATAYDLAIKAGALNSEKLTEDFSR